MQKWNGRPPKLGLDETQKLREIVAKRAQLPTNAELARRLGISRRTLQDYLRGFPKRFPV